MAFTSKINDTPHEVDADIARLWVLQTRMEAAEITWKNGPSVLNRSFDVARQKRRTAEVGRCRA